jgi:hypothetical protein
LLDKQNRERRGVATNEWIRIYSSS